LPLGTTAYTVTAVLVFYQNSNIAYGSFNPSIVATNPSTGYSAVFTGSPANYKVIDFMNYPTAGTAVGGGSGLSPNGQTTLIFRYQGQFFSSSQAVANYQIVVTTWGS
jgi:hypothetical protein